MKKSIFGLVVALALASFSLSASANSTIDDGPQFKADKVYSVVAIKHTAMNQVEIVASSSNTLTVNHSFVPVELQPVAILNRDLTIISSPTSGRSSFVASWRPHGRDNLRIST